MVNELDRPDTFSLPEGSHIVLNDEWSHHQRLMHAELDHLELVSTSEARILKDEVKDFYQSAEWSNVQRARNVYQRIEQFESSRNPDEPSELELIKERTSEIRPINADQNLRDRLHGAWLGRAAGCLLGKPVESLPAAAIRKYLSAHDAYPLRDYVPAPRTKQEAHGLHPSHTDTTVPNIVCMPRDDDMDYPMINLSIAERLGNDWTTEDVAETWLRELPYLGVYTAERVAYRNLSLGTGVDESGLLLNPYREWIGAQIRGDVWGYLNPGNPSIAAELGHRDARLSHRGIGIYGEMFASALLACSLVMDDTREALETALITIPPGSRFAKCVREVFSYFDTGLTWDATLENIINTYSSKHWIHVLPNVAIVVAALLHGRNDFEAAITLTVMGGHDTDSNGATVGSVMGAILGSSGLPPKWIDPLANRVRSDISDFDNSKLTDLADRTFKIAKR